MSPDEDSFVVPPKARRAMLAWLGETEGVTAQPAPKAVAPSYDGKWLRQSLGAGHSDPEIVSAARAFMAGAADVDGAAALIAGFGARDPLFAFLDHLRLAHGLVFAVDAVIRSTTITSYGFWDRDYPDALRREPAVHLDRDLTDYLPRLRDAVARCDPEEHREAVATLLSCDTGPAGRAAAAFLTPDSEALVWAALSLAPGSDLMPAYVFRADMLDDAPAAFTSRSSGPVPAMLRTAFVRFGPDSFGYLRRVAAEAEVKPVVALAIDLAAHLPTDDAAEFVLAEHSRGTTALTTLVERFPRRTLRLLAQPGRRALLTRVVTQNVDVVRSVLGDLDGADRKIVGDVLAGVRVIPDVAAADVPEVLISPPWTGARVRLPVIDGLSVEDRPILVSEVHVDAETFAYYGDGGGFVRPEQVMAQILATGNSRWDIAISVGVLSAEQLLSVLPALKPYAGSYGQYGDERAAMLIANKVGAEAYPFLTAVARTSTAGFDAMLHFVGADLTDVVVDWLHRKGPRRELATRWFHRNGPAAVRYLVPAALGSAEALRVRALAALTVIVGDHGIEAVERAVASEFPPEVREAVSRVLTRGSTALLPKRIPALPAWLNEPGLPQLIVADRSGAVPRAHSTPLITMLRLSTIEVPGAGLDSALRGLDVASVAEFGWSLFEQWRDAGAPSKDGWVLEALAHIGDDRTAGQLGPIIAAWPGAGQHKRAVTGLDVLTSIGSERALMELDRIARRVKFSALKEHAGRRVIETAEALGLTTDELADRLVPDLGLDESGGVVLDFGGRAFTISFDEALRPVLVDENGRTRKALPKPSASDDAERAAAATKRFSVIKKDARALAGDQITRLRTAMRHQRRWQAEDFRSYLVGHPLLVHLVRRFVWGAYQDSDPATEPSMTFRVAEDRSFADHDDENVSLPDGAVIGLVHPLQLDPATTQAWTSVFADYCVLQPFPQLLRPRYRPTEGQLQLPDLAPALLAGPEFVVRTRGALGLARLGWDRGEVLDGGVETYMSYSCGGATVTIGLDPGIVAGEPESLGEHQTITSLRVRPGAFAALPPVLLSELLTDLDEARG